ncbi:MAG: helix-turn-helix domain-containing protein [Armatimonadetes bacterium]|nr:helix-turn-helix domain-containing protein [Armatimonadota bacterium]
MKYAATRVTLRGRERRVLQRVVRAHTSEQREVLRARIVLMASLGDNNCEIARELFCDLKTVRKWRARFAELRLEGLWDAPRSGRPEQFTVSQRHETFAVMALTPPFPYARWSVQPAQRLGLHIVPTLLATESGHFCGAPSRWHGHCRLTWASSCLKKTKLIGSELKGETLRHDGDGHKARPTPRHQIHRIRSGSLKHHLSG